MNNVIFKSLLLVLCFCCLPLAASIDIDHLERQLIEMINDEREKEGQNRLAVWEPLTLVARKHSQNMADRIVKFDHIGFQERIDEVLEYGPISKIGENLAFSYRIKDYLKSAVRGWMKSPGHRENLLDDFEVTGIGIAFDEKGKFFVTQLFATRRQ